MNEEETVVNSIFRDSP